MTRPFLSIVTAARNRAGMVGDAIESVLEQGLDAKTYEHIVVDGASTDGTLDVLARYPHLRVVSEPDEGVYDAMNKGIAMARGEIVALLNSDDQYPHGALQPVLNAFSTSVDMVVGGAAVVDLAAAERHEVLVYYPAPDPAMRLFDITRGVAVTNARFMRRRLFDDLGLFDATLRIAADREWLVRAWRAGVRAARVDKCVYEYGHHDDSLTIGRSSDRAYADYLTICRRLLPDEDLLPPLRTELRRWDAQTRYRQVRHVFHVKGWRAAFGTATRHLQAAPDWPVRALVQKRQRPSQSSR